MFWRHLGVILLLTSLLLFCTEEASAKSSKYDFGQVAFIILSQPHPRHAAIADETKKILVKSLKGRGVKKPKVFTLHKDLPVHGGWTITPIATLLVEKTPPMTEWYAFIDESANVNLTILNEILLGRESMGEFFIGHAIPETKSCIIHHWDQNMLPFPDMKAGFLISRPLLRYIAKEIVKGPFELKGLPIDHSIDAPFELAKTIFMLKAREGTRFDRVLQRYVPHGPLLEHEPRFCTSYSPECAIYPRDVTCKITREASVELVDRTLFAVKTNLANHAKRLPIVMSTWAPATKNIIYVSEVEDPDYGTTVLPGADFNTILGHCNKTEAILKHFARTARSNNWKWLVIADDDTMISISKLMDAIQCYDKDDGVKVALGERYGFRVNGPGKLPGADFLVGGSSIVFNVDLVEYIMDPSHDKCTCEHPGYPDDIHLGECLRRLNVPLVHHDQFHQVGPDDLHPSRLAHQGALSFHKFDLNDPYETYNTWFRAHDEHLKPKEKDARMEWIEKELERLLREKKKEEGAGVTVDTNSHQEL